jgi:hypothetical protein
MLFIDAELAMGRRAAARRRARSFVAAHPDSPHRHRLRALLEAPAEDDDHKGGPEILPTSRNP